MRIFQPPHKRLEDAEDRQRDLEQAFEDMYMMQTGVIYFLVLYNLERHGGLMVSALDSGSNGLGLRSGQGRCVVSLGIVPLSTQVYKWVPGK